MTFLKRHQNALLSLMFIVFTIELFCLLFFGGLYFQTLYIFVLIPILNALGIYFAVRCKKSGDSLAGAILLIIGIIAFVVIILNYAPSYIVHACL